jgi:hypothetical protein
VVEGATIYLIDEWKPPLSVNEFISSWGAFEIHILYENKEYTRFYDQDYINQKMAREMTGIVGPRVTPRK